MPANPDLNHNAKSTVTLPENLKLQPSHPKEVRSEEVRSNDVDEGKLKNRFSSGRCPQESEEDVNEQYQK
jgi:hypothetical protein